jgi:hypothetical protein
MRLTRSIAAGLIRQHLWQPRPPCPTADGRAWTMGRELAIWDRLIHHVTPEELNGAITQLRTLTNAPGPIRLTWFIRREKGIPLLHRAVAAWHNSSPCLTPPQGPTRGGGFVRLSVELPPPSIEVEP